ncbi:hypothetical protein BDFB_013815, partial [Asbolus verrucosus]
NLSANSTSNLKSHLLNNFLIFSGLNQYNNTVNSFGRILDLICSNLYTDNVFQTDSLVIQDPHHPALSVNVHLKNLSTKTLSACKEKYSYNFKKAHFQGLYDALLSTDWSFLQVCLDVNLACKVFYDKLYALFDKFVPKTPYCKRKFPAWFSSEVKFNIKRKTKYIKMYRRTRCENYYVLFKNLRKSIKLQIKSDYTLYVKSVEDSLTSDPKKFWSYTREKRGSSSIPRQMCYKDVTFIEPHHVVNAFSSYFSSVY